MLDLRLSKVKVYQELIHEILSSIPRRTLDDVPATMRTVRIQAKQLQVLLQRWHDMPCELRVNRLRGGEDRVHRLGGVGRQRTPTLQ